MKYNCDFYINLSVIALEKLCSSHKWYDLGDSEDISILLNKTLKDNITTDDIMDIAIDIVAHTSEMSFEDVSCVCNLILQQGCFCIIFDDVAESKIVNEVIRQETSILKKVNQRLRGDKT